MAIVRNLSNGVITTITAGNIIPNGEKKVADWEVSILENFHGNKIMVIPEAKKKGKK
jgi:hypothetical protein